MENTSVPIVVIGIGGLIAFSFKGFPRTVGYLTIVAGIGMLLVKRS
jgi:hypothetical protein